MSALVVCGVMWWWFPTHILEENEVNKITIIRVVNKNSGNEFEIAGFNDVSIIVKGIGEKTFRKKSVNSENIEYWYRLTFYDENGKVSETLDIQNKHIIKKYCSDQFAIYYYCNEGLDVVTDCLERAEALQFPDYNKDPDF